MCTVGDIKCIHREVPGGPVVGFGAFTARAQVPSLVGEPILEAACWHSQKKVYSQCYYHYHYNH